MIEFLICGANLSCQFKNLQGIISNPKYPAEIAEICYYHEQQKVELPEYCQLYNNFNPIRKRNEF